MFYIVTKLDFTIFCHKIGKGLIAQHMAIRELLAFFLCIQKENQDIKPKLKAEGIESSIFPLVWLNSSKICTTSIPGIPGVISFPLHNSFKPTYFLFLQT